MIVSRLFDPIAWHAYALTVTSLPDPTDIALLALAIGGLIIGYRSSPTPPQKKSDDESET